LQASGIQFHEYFAADLSVERAVFMGAITGTHRRGQSGRGPEGGSLSFNGLGDPLRVDEVVLVRTIIVMSAVSQPMNSDLPTKTPRAQLINYF
jgi:hypothetical protein